LQKLFGTAANGTAVVQKTLQNGRKSNLTLAGKSKMATNLGAIKKRADLKRILAFQKARADRKNGTASVLPIRGKNVTLLRSKFMNSKNITLTKLPVNSNQTIVFAHLPSATNATHHADNATHHAGNATVPLVKLAPLRAANATVKGKPVLLKAPVLKAGNSTVGNMTEAQLAARRKAVLAKFAQLGPKAAGNGSVKGAKK
jgi:hypothetical protein